MRILRAEVLPKVLEVLRPLVVGDGTIEVVSSDAYDTRVECSFALRHNTDGPKYTSRLYLFHDTHERCTESHFDWFGNGQTRSIQPDRAVIVGLNPLTGKELSLRS